VSGVYRAVLFDLFGTLIRVDAAAVPEIVLDGRPVRSTLGVWHGLLERVLPGVGVDAFARALRDASADLERERGEGHVELPTRERFRRALVRLGRDGGDAPETAALFSRAHMRAIADATRFPAEHAEVLAHAARRGPVAVITNFDDTGTAHAILARHGILGRLRCVVVSETVGLRKPHPALVRIALRELDVSPDEAVMVGDHLSEDVGAATAAGVDAIWIDAHGAGQSDIRPAPRHIVRTLPQIVPLL
jgi:HAD superfamily hydrolase (TIGR01509 family)